MEKVFKTILIVSILIFGVGILFVSSANAQDELVVQYWTGTEWKPLAGPLFEETNFLPGQSVTRLVKVTNNSGQSQRIVTEAINYPGFISGSPRPHTIPSDDLSRALSLIIREKGGSDLYGGSTGQKSLYDFYQAGETYLSDIVNGNGGIKEYEFEISFPSEEENEWQGKTTNFVILVGFQGVGGGVPPGGGGGGGGLPPGLTLNYEKAFYIGTTTATITWTTSYFSTSQVIYDTVAGKFDLAAGPPNYGYAYSKEGDDSGLEKVTGHSVTITGLTPGTTYYYRVVSHASPPSISLEHQFTTKQAAGVVFVPPETGQPPGGAAPPAAGGPALPRGAVAGTQVPPAGAADGEGEEAEEAGEVKGEVTETTPTALPQEACNPKPWWPFGYIIYLLLLGMVVRFRKKLPVILFWALLVLILASALAWWWFEPCPAHFWYWPTLIVAAWLASLWRSRKASRFPPTSQQQPPQSLSPLDL